MKSIQGISHLNQTLAKNGRKQAEAQSQFANVFKKALKKCESYASSIRPSYRSTC